MIDKTNFFFIANYIGGHIMINVQKNISHDIKLASFNVCEGHFTIGTSQKRKLTVRMFLGTI